MRKCNFNLFLFYFIYCLVCGLPELNAQSIKDLERRKKSLLTEIEKTSELLNQTSDQKANAMSKLLTIESQVSRREQLLQTIRSELTMYRDSLEFVNKQVTALEDYLAKLQNEYTKISQRHFIQKKLNAEQNYLISSNSMDQLFKRLFYLRQYHEIREKQLINLVQTVHEYHAIQLKLMLIEKEKEGVLNEQSVQKKKLSSEIKQQNAFVDQLKGREKEFRQDLSKKEKEVQELESAIKTAIITAMKEQKRNARTVKAAGSFEAAKGILRAPLNGSIILKKFGVQPHPTLKGIKVKNNGVDLASNVSGAIRPVMGGVVRGIMNIPGYNKVVLISHGEYFTLYGNLEKIQVKKNQEVQSSDILGFPLKSVETGHYTVHFEIWKGKDILNPEEWLSFQKI
jgi:septal ring factor EnvC (AmiA/AmiB activator)